MKHALSINGGGIRGIIPCSVLAALEQRTGKLTRDLFAYVSGTSTGALLAAAVAAGVPAGDLLAVYTTRSQEVFTPSGVIGEAKRVATGFMYDPRRLHCVLTSVFGKAAGWAVNDCPVGICIPATAANGHNWYFVRDGARNAGTTGSVKLIDAAVASACAPTYFDCWPVRVQGKPLWFFDGGSGGVANPSYEACAEMFEYDQFMPAEIRMVCLGTGFYKNSDVPPKGLLDLVCWVTDTLVDSSEDWVDRAVARQWPGIARKFNWQLPADIAMDDLSAIPALLAVGATAAASLGWNEILGASV
jgi:patatin-like phospholipase/acyl hydrolase